MTDVQSVRCSRRQGFDLGRQLAASGRTFHLVDDALSTARGLDVGKRHEAFLSHVPNEQGPTVIALDSVPTPGPFLCPGSSIRRISRQSFERSLPARACNLHCKI